MKNNHPLQGRGQVLVGVAVVLMGCLFLLDNLGIADINVRMHFWPALLIIFGAMKLSQARTTAGYVVGGGLLAFGCLMTLGSFGFIHFNGRALWPLALIVAGLAVVSRSAQGPRQSRRMRRRERVSLEKEREEPYTRSSFDVPPRPTMAQADDSDSIINITAVLASFTRRIVAADFRGGEITAVIGSCDLDLRQSVLIGEAVIDVFTVCGGITIRVPPDWTVILQGTPMLGGFEEKTVLPPDGSKRLIIRGYAIVGGLEVRN